MKKLEAHQYKNFLDDFEEELIVSSPGRINFIGEHTDYNEGFVLPTAIDKKITLSFQKNTRTQQCRIYSADYDKMLEVDLNSVAPSTVEWENYILGVLHELLLLTDKLQGFDCILKSDLPIGAGISSSAALECGLAYGLNELFDLKLSKMTLVELSQRAEHNYVGSKCGIMDQFASVMSQEQKIILLDCKTQAYELINADLDPYVILLLNTNVSHNLITTEYNNRRAECEAVVQQLAKKDTTINSLRDSSLPVLQEAKAELTPIQYQRASYVIEENERVLRAVEAIQSSDLQTFGRLMYESHKGLKLQYEVSCKELDFLVEFSKPHDQLIGSRMMGGGFGGCTINLIHKDYVEKYTAEVKKAYKQAFDITLTAFTTVPSQGTSAKRSYARL